MKRDRLQVRSWNRVNVIGLAVLSLLAILLLCGCEYAFIHKGDIHEFHQCLRTYRAGVQPISEPEKVNRLGDNLEKILNAWKGECDEYKSR